MSNAKTIDPQNILAVLQQRFPREYEICLQAAYISNLEGALQDKKGDDGNELPE